MSFCSAPNGTENAKRARKGSDLQKLMEETEDQGEEDQKITSVASDEHTKHASILSGDVSDKLVSLKSEEIDESDNLPNAVRLA